MDELKNSLKKEFQVKVSTAHINKLLKKTKKRKEGQYMLKILGEVEQAMFEEERVLRNGAK